MLGGLFIYAGFALVSSIASMALDFWATTEVDRNIKTLQIQKEPKLLKNAYGLNFISKKLLFFDSVKHFTLQLDYNFIFTIKNFKRRVVTQKIKPVCVSNSLSV